MEQVERWLKRKDWNRAAAELFMLVNRTDDKRLKEVVSYTLDRLQGKDYHGFWRHAAWYLYSEIEKRKEEKKRTRRDISHPRELYLIFSTSLFDPTFFMARRTEIEEEIKELERHANTILNHEQIRKEVEVIEDLRKKFESVKNVEELENLIREAIKHYENIYDLNIDEKIPYAFVGNIHPDQLRKHSPLYQLIWDMSVELSKKKGRFIHPSEVKRKKK